MPIDNIAAANFYKDDGDKINQNWFLYEYANVLYTKIAENKKLTQYRKQHDKKDKVAFCIYFSKRLRKSIHDVQVGNSKGTTIDARYIYEFYPDNSYAQTDALLNAAMAAWKEHILICTNCPNSCLAHWYDITPMFDNLEKTGWPT